MELLIFAQALDALLKPKEGVFLELKGKALEIGAEKVVVFNNASTNEITIIDASERTDLKHGDRITMVYNDEIKN